jgi:hypothetical protein
MCTEFFSSSCSIPTSVGQCRGMQLHEGWEMGLGTWIFRLWRIMNVAPMPASLVGLRSILLKISN